MKYFIAVLLRTVWDRGGVEDERISLCRILDYLSNWEKSLIDPLKMIWASTACKESDKNVSVLSNNP